MTEILPPEVFGINELSKDFKPSLFSTMLQDIKVSVDLSKRPLNELGRKGPYFKFVEFPIEVSQEMNEKIYPPEYNI